MICFGSASRGHPWLVKMTNLLDYRTDRLLLFKACDFSLVDKIVYHPRPARLV